MSTPPARNHPDGDHGLQTALGMHELQGDLACRADGDPMVVFLDAQGSLTDRHHRLGEDPRDGDLLPAGQGEV